MWGRLPGAKGHSWRYKSRVAMFLENTSKSGRNLRGPSRVPVAESWEAPGPSKEEPPIYKLVIPHLDWKLSVRLLGDNLWLGRIKLRARARESFTNVDVDTVIMRALEIYHGRGNPVYAALKSKDAELRLLAVDSRIGIALVRPEGGVAGKVALDEALHLPRGRATLYILSQPVPL